MKSVLQFGNNPAAPAGDGWGGCVCEGVMGE